MISISKYRLEKSQNEANFGFWKGMNKAWKWIFAWIFILSVLASFLLSLPGIVSVNWQFFTIVELTATFMCLAFLQVIKNGWILFFDWIVSKVLYNHPWLSRNWNYCEDVRPDHETEITILRIICMLVIAFTVQTIISYYIGFGDMKSATRDYFWLFKWFWYIGGPVAFIALVLSYWIPNFMFAAKYAKFVKNKSLSKIMKRSNSTSKQN